MAPAHTPECHGKECIARELGMRRSDRIVTRLHTRRHGAPPARMEVHGGMSATHGSTVVFVGVGYGVGVDIEFEKRAARVAVVTL